MLLSFLRPSIISLALGFWLFSSCQEAKKEPIFIGFVGTLTGPYSDLGVSGRDGVILAVEEKNSSGGLLGRSLELLIRDDKNDPDIAIKADSDLIQKGVIAIIGHMTSTMSMAALPLINESGTVMVSPTSASSHLSGRKDFFFRAYEPIEQEVRDLATWIREKEGIERMAVAYDVRNPAFAKDYAERFENAYREMGGQVLITLGTEAGNSGEIVRLAERLLAYHIECLLIVHNALDTAFLLNVLRSGGWKGKAFASAWSMTREILEQGGQTVEGLQSIVPFLPDHPSQKYIKFRENFLRRFRREPDFPAVCGYEAAQLIFKAYERSRAPGRPLARAIVEIGEFEGLQSKIVMDQFGDPKRKKFRVIIRNGKMERVR